MEVGDVNPIIKQLRDNLADILNLSNPYGLFLILILLLLAFGEPRLTSLFRRIFNVEGKEEE